MGAGRNVNHSIFQTIELHRAMKGQIEIEHTFRTMLGDLADRLVKAFSRVDAFALIKSFASS